MRCLILLLLWVCVICAAAPAIEPPLSKSPIARNLRHRTTLDDTTTVLLVRAAGGGIILDWFPLPDIHFWAVTASSTPDFSTVDTLAMTSGTEYIDMSPLQTRRFYRVDGVDMPPPPDSVIAIETFEDGVPGLQSIPGEDDDPLDYEVSSDDSYQGDYCLRLFGDTWKRETVSVTRLDTHSVWEVAMKLVERSELMAFGVADSANYLYYVIWGTEAPQSLQWNTVYEGWFDTSEWVSIRFPLGEDWLGRFGYLPRILELRYVNDNDNTNPPGEVRFDEIRDVTLALSDPPVAAFTYSVVSQTNDSLRIAFHSMSYDLDSQWLVHAWDFGDGQRTSIASPEHTFPAHGRYPVTLAVTDDSANTSWKTVAIVDSPFSQTRELTMAFTGDAMIGRGFDNNDGIIETYGVDTLFSATRPLLEPLDLASVNLECALTNATEHHPTKAIWFKGRPSSVSGIVNAGIDFVCLANNHILDYMSEGLVETIQIMDSVGVVHGGAGLNDLSARRVKFLSANGLSLAMLSFSDRTGSYNNVQPFLDAGRSRAGFAMWNRTAIESTIPEASTLADFVVLNVHSGSEYQLQPQLSLPPGFDPWDPEVIIFELIPDTTERVLRQYAIDMGADLVVTHHPHVMQGFEVYNGKLIAHSMGNFVFDMSYFETQPSVILHTHFSDGVGVDQATVHPIYLDHWIPRPATGGLGQAILDYEANMSRLLNTWLVRNPGEDTARIIWDTTQTVTTSQEFVDTLSLFEDDGEWISHPWKMRGDGYAVSVEVLSPGGLEVRYGRDILWFGSMENEGANQWLLNSGDEGYSTAEFHSGARSIRLRRNPNPQNVVTNIENRAPMTTQSTYSVAGWIKTLDAVDAVYQIQYWTQRGGGTQLAQVDIGAPLSGTQDWTLISENINVPATTLFYVLRMSLTGPQSGTAYAWFDDVAVVEWKPWEASSAEIPFPSDNTYLQVRASSAITTAIVRYVREWVL